MSHQMHQLEERSPAGLPWELFPGSFVLPEGKILALDPCTFRIVGSVMACFYTFGPWTAPGSPPGSKAIFPANPTSGQMTTQGQISGDTGLGSPRGRSVSVWGTAESRAEGAADGSEKGAGQSGVWELTADAWFHQQSGTCLQGPASTRWQGHAEQTRGASQPALLASCSADELGQNVPHATQPSQSPPWLASVSQATWVGWWGRFLAALVPCEVQVFYRLGWPQVAHRIQTRSRLLRPRLSAATHGGT